MTISAIYFLDNKGKVIISRDYRSNTSHKCVERFVSRVLEEDENDLKPVFEEDGTNYVYVKHSNLYGTFKSLAIRIFSMILFKNVLTCVSPSPCSFHIKYRCIYGCFVPLQTY